ncbi:uncharacterized protein LOC115759645 [Drosophila novamexicana]|uniref:uncharacterized protein LOC115759645 n=1 Tax=Drosophila novamexicana TaxID=47314 RepID=UPI0011E5AEA6|nr:uncharacterized protein LOC115759645 [Drosophila novamexicana]
MYHIRFRTIFLRTSSKLNPVESIIQVTNIPKLSDDNNYWQWRVLLRSYLDARGLWCGDCPDECPKSKFILLSTLEAWLILREYETKTASDIFKDLESRYGTRK